MMPVMDGFVATEEIGRTQNGVTADPCLDREGHAR